MGDGVNKWLRSGDPCVKTIMQMLSDLVLNAEDGYRFTNVNVFANPVTDKKGYGNRCLRMMKDMQFLE
jgi:hypothetical protein